MTTVVPIGKVPSAFYASIMPPRTAQGIGKRASFDNHSTLTSPQQYSHHGHGHGVRDRMAQSLPHVGGGGAAPPLGHHHMAFPSTTRSMVSISSHGDQHHDHHGHGIGGHQLSGHPEHQPHRLSATHGHGTSASAQPPRQADPDDENNPEVLQEEIDDLADRLAQVERVTSMLTPEYTASLQRKLQSSFTTIGDRVTGE